MKKTITLLFCVLFTLSLAVIQAEARIEWEFQNKIALDETPLDMAVEKSGKTIYILCDKSIKVYSRVLKKITDTIPLTSKVSGITLSERGDKLFLTDSDNMQISVLEITPIHDIEIGHSTIIGNPEAPVNIVVFTDFQ